MEAVKLTRIEPEGRASFRKLAEKTGVWACFTCRTCTASCPVSAVNPDFNPLRIIRMALYGLERELLEGQTIWLCTSCYACQERCPQGVYISEFINHIKNAAFASGNLPQGIRAQRDLVRSEGRIYPIDDFDNKKRGKAGLPELPTECDAAKMLFKEDGND